LELAPLERAHITIGQLKPLTIRTLICEAAMPIAKHPTRTNAPTSVPNEPALKVVGLTPIRRFAS
jgi:hypothetical protein